jgi:GT2 family glycosyltransferase
MNRDCVVTVIIVAFQGDRWIRHCVETLLLGTRAPMQLILVDNGRTTALEPICGEFRLTPPMVTQRPLGFADANNLALGHVDPRAEAICFLNQDTLSQAGWLDECVDVLRKGETLGAVVPLTHTYNWSAWDPAFYECAGRANGLTDALERGAKAQRVCEVPVVPAAAMVVKAETLRRAGPFDPVFGSYYEDYDLCRRIRAAGYGVGIVTTARVAHYSGSSTQSHEAAWRRGRAIVRNRVLYETRLAGAARVPALLRYFGQTFPRKLMRSVAGRLAHPPTQFLAGHFDLLRILPRLASERRDIAAWQRELRRTGIIWRNGSERAIPPSGRLLDATS